MITDDDDDEFDIPPVYRAPVVSHGSDPTTGPSLGIALSLTALLVGLFAVVPAHWQWLLDGIGAFSACGLIYACRAWRRAVFGA